MMKKYGILLLLASLLLCTACGKEPATQPPKDSLMMKSTFVIADGKVTEKALNSVSPDFKRYYAYTLSQGVEKLQDGAGGAHGKLTFAQMQKALDTLAAYTADPGLAFAGPYVQCDFRPEAVWYAVSDQAAQAFQWFFVYSVSENKITPLSGTYSGVRDLGVLTLSNIDYYGNITDGTKQGKWCYVFIDR